MRRFVVVLVVALMALTLVACGGGDDPEPVAEPDVGDAAPPPVVEEDPDYSPVEESVFEPFPVDPEVGLPESIRSRLDARQPMIILFMDETQDGSEYQVEVIEGVMETYRGLIDLVTFDVGRYVTHAEDGRITVDPAINEDEASRQVGRMIDVDNLDVRYTPFTIVVDKQAHVTWRYRGISDDKTLEREVLKVTE